LYFKYINKIALYSSRVGFFFLSIVVSGIVTNIIKVVLGKARPKILEYDDFYGLTWFNLDHAYQSFPSGHTTTAFAIFASLSIMFPKYIWVFLFYALAIAFARIGFFAHYPSDVMAGAIVGIGATLILQKKYFKELVAFDK
jgi:membrane-associated phospholipid phosphatase